MAGELVGSEEPCDEQKWAEFQVNSLKRDASPKEPVIALEV
jgi:hypothetical protein